MPGARGPGFLGDQTRTISSSSSSRGGQQTASLGLIGPSGKAWLRTLFAWRHSRCMERRLPLQPGSVMLNTAQTLRTLVFL